jgi:preprotein translocase subunit SecD
VTLGLGILTTLFSAVFVTRLIVEQWFDWRRPKALDV